MGYGAHDRCFEAAETETFVKGVGDSGGPHGVPKRCRAAAQLAVAQVQPQLARQSSTLKAGVDANPADFTIRADSHTIAGYRDESGTIKHAKILPRFNRA